MPKKIGFNDTRRDSRRSWSGEADHEVVRTQEPERFPLDRPSSVIGRGKECDVCVDERLVSRRHARIAAVLDGWMIEDLGSTNGTYVNLIAVERCVLRDADAVHIGRFAFKFLAGDAPGLPPKGGADPEGSAAATVWIVRN